MLEFAGLTMGSKPQIKSMALIPMISCRGNIRQECLGLSIVGIVKSGNQDAFIQ
jgi:hypothetical protein